MNLELDNRDGLPPDLLILLEKYPREIWPAHTNLGETARFWLQRHAMFRELGATLRGATVDFREGQHEAEPFRRFLAPRLQFFLQSLEEHHHIEDLHYFPVFRAAESRLIKGFDVLENDHAFIHGEILGTLDAANALLASMASADASRAATDHYAETSDKLLRTLTRHLDDEEDLIVPVILDQGERKLFSGVS